MRTATTIGRRHGSQKWELLFGPETPVQDQRGHMRKLQLSRTNPDWEEVRVDESDQGTTIRDTFTLVAKTRAPTPSTGGEAAPAIKPKHQRKTDL